MKSKKKIPMYAWSQKSKKQYIWVIPRLPTSPMFMTLNFVYILCNVLPYFDPNIKEEKKDLLPKKDFINIYLYVQAKTMKTSNQSF